MCFRQRVRKGSTYKYIMNHPKLFENEIMLVELLAVAVAVSTTCRVPPVALINYEYTFVGPY